MDRSADVGKLAVFGSDVAEGDASSVQFSLLRGKILSGELRPGQQLVESSLSAQAGVSRTPIREALARLESEGLVERSGRGLRVRTRTIEEIQDIHEVRLALDTAAARFAAERRSSIDIARLRHVGEREYANVPAGDNSSLHREWRVAIRHASHNSQLTTSADTFDTLLRLYEVNLFPTEQELRDAADQHSAVTEAIIQRDGDHAGRLVETISLDVRDRHIKALISTENRS